MLSPLLTVSICLIYKIITILLPSPSRPSCSLYTIIMRIDMRYLESALVWKMMSTGRGHGTWYRKSTTIIPVSNIQNMIYLFRTLWAFPCFTSYNSSACEQTGIDWYCTATSLNIRSKKSQGIRMVTTLKTERTPFWGFGKEERVQLQHTAVSRMTPERGYAVRPGILWASSRMKETLDGVTHLTATHPVHPPENHQNTSPVSPQLVESTPAKGQTLWKVGPPENCQIPPPLRQRPRHLQGLVSSLGATAWQSAWSWPEAPCASLLY